MEREGEMWRGKRIGLSDRNTIEYRNYTETSNSVNTTRSSTSE